MKARISNMYQTLMWAWCLSSTACATDPLTSTFWQQVTSGLVVTSHDTPSSPAAGGSLRATRLRSKVECAWECSRHSDCFSIAFDSTSGDCYLQPDLRNDQTHPAHLGQMWAKDSTCHTKDSPVSNGIVEWDDTLTSPRWTVKCKEEFMTTTDNVNVTCMAGGYWLSKGECVRHIWTNPTSAFFDVPVPPTSGWTVCLEAIPTSDSAFYINLVVDAANLALHIVSRIFNKNLLTASKLNGQWTPSGFSHIDPYPLSVGKPFGIKIKFTSSRKFEIYMNDTLGRVYSQDSRLPASDVTRVEVSGAVRVTRVDLWCHN